MNQQDRSIEAGDKVRLKGGGPVMTVRVISGTQAHCVWFPDANQPRFGAFDLKVLELAWGVPEEPKRGSDS